MNAIVKNGVTGLDREKVIKGLHQHCEGSMFDRCGECPYYEIDHEPFICRDMLLLDLNAIVHEQPLVRKTAHWVFGNTMGHSWMKCSECCVSQSGQTGCWTYCPNCGAEMLEETVHEDS